MKLQRCNWAILCAVLFGSQVLHTQQVTYVQLRTANGVLEGVISPDGKVRTFKGIPYAAPPVGPLRWKPPQPDTPWTNIRNAVEYPRHCMQGTPNDDVIFNDAGPSEDCLYLNLWMPAKPAVAKLPVIVWIHGGDFVAGTSSEPRQDAGNLSKKGVMVVSLNYRLGVFGFFAYPELSKESKFHASGNYGLLDQVAALEWVKRNIATFGGDPDNVTIAGESAGSSSISALMASPLSQGLFCRAIGESGAFFSAALPLRPRIRAEEAGTKFTQAAFGAVSLDELRAMPAQKLLDAALKRPPEYFSPDIDGYFLPVDLRLIYASGRQSHVSLLAGWNQDESSFRSFFGNAKPTVDNFVMRAKARFGNNAEAFLKRYPATSDAEAKRAAQDFAGDQSTAHATWKWIEMQLKTGKSPVFRYEFDQTLPLLADAKPGTASVAPQASEIEFVFRVLSSKKLPWRPADHELSELMSSYWTNFAKTGDPNGPGLVQWPAYSALDGYQVMHLSAHPGAAPDGYRSRYEFLDHLSSAHH